MEFSSRFDYSVALEVDKPASLETQRSVRQVLFKVIVFSSSSPTLLLHSKATEDEVKLEEGGCGTYIYGQVTHRPHAEPGRWRDNDTGAGEIDGMEH